MFIYFVPFLGARALVMMVFTILFSVWLFLLLRSAFAEYKYYQSVKTLEPHIWQQLGAPKYLNVPIVFVSSKGVKLLRGATNKEVCEHAKNHRKTGIQFLVYIVLVLVVSTVYFKLA